MLVHLGQDYVVPSQSIVAVFDMDTATVSAKTRALLARLEQENRVFSIFEDLPKSAVLCENALGETLYLSQLAPLTILRRLTQLETRND